MLFKETLLYAIDNSGANIVKTIQIYSSSTKYSNFLGKLLKVSLYKRRKKLKRVLVKRVFYYAILVNQKKSFARLNGHYIKSTRNRVVLLSLTKSLLGNRFYGPIFNELRLLVNLNSIVLASKRLV